MFNQSLKEMFQEAIDLFELSQSFIYFGLAFLLIQLYVFIFEKFTPYNDQKEIEGKNEAVSIQLSAKRLGMTIIVAASIFHNPNLLAVVIWATIGFFIQILVYLFVEWKTKYSVEQEIANGNVAVAKYVAGYSISISILVAFAAIM